MSKAAVELARVQLEKMRIVAPFAGIVGLRHVSVGEYLTAGQALVNLEAIDPVKADFRVPEKFLPAIRTGQGISIRLDAFPGETFKGEVYAIDPRIDVSGRSLLVRAKVPNPDRRLRPGLFARVTVLLQLKQDALTIPEQAIVPQGDSQFVFKIVDGKVTLTKVKIGMRRSGRVEILDGLSVDDEVVTAGQLKLRDGAAGIRRHGRRGLGVTLPELSIKRPVFATVMSLVLVLVGLVSYDRLSVREYPAIDPPVITVETDYPGASAAIVETQVTQVLEDSLAGIEGIDFITSISRQELSQITVTFKLDRNPDYAAADIRDRVGRVRGRLPEEIDEPIIQKREADAQPIMYLAFSSKRHSALEITDYADRYVKDQLTTLNGVAEVRLFGDRAYSMRIWLDPERLAAYQLTPQDVENALRRQNVEVPSGRIESLQREFTVLAETDLRTPRAIQRSHHQGCQ